jgi:hypothetical protein
MLREASNLQAESMTRPIGGQHIGLVRAGEHEGLRRELGRMIERLAVERMRLPAIGPVDLLKQEIVVEIGAQSLRGGDANIHLVTQQRRGDRVPSRDVDQDLHLWMPVVELRKGGIEALAHQAGDDLNRYPAPYFFAEVAKPLRNVARQRIKRPAGLSDERPFIGQFETARSALRLEPFERKTERRLLAPESGATDPTGLGDFVESVEEIPIDIAREFWGGTDRNDLPLNAFRASKGESQGLNSTTAWRDWQSGNRRGFGIARWEEGRRVRSSPARACLVMGAVSA